MAQRIESIDIARALAIICVVIGHAVSDETLCNIVIYSFHMPCFFVLAGIFLKPANENFLQSLKIFSHKKFLSLVVPFFIWGLIYAKFSFKSLAFISYGSWPCLRMAGTLSSLWFLPVLFLSLIFSYVALSLLRNCIKRDYLRGGICFMLLFFAGLFIPHNRLYGLPWGIDIALMAASFICLGYCGKVVLSKCTLKWWHSLVLLAIMLCVFVFSAPHSNSDVGYMLMANSEYGQPVLFLTNSVLGTAILLIVASLISRIPCKKRLLNFLGCNSMTIFLVHKPFLEMGHKVAAHFAIDFNAWWFVMANVATALCTSVIISLVINKFAPWLAAKTVCEHPVPTA